MNIPTWEEARDALAANEGTAIHRLIFEAEDADPKHAERFRDLVANALAEHGSAVTAERDALRQDAERYRWLRTRINYRDVVPPASLGGLWPPTERQWTHISYDMSNETIDESIDAAMSR